MTTKDCSLLKNLPIMERNNNYWSNNHLMEGKKRRSKIGKINRQSGRSHFAFTFRCT